MSGVVKGVKKVFKGAVKVVKKVWKPLLVAAAIYFTAGLALSAFPATASFAAALPGFAGGGTLGLGIGAGATAGTGVFTSLATTLGVGGGLTAASTGIASGAAAASTAAVGEMAALGSASVAADTAAITGMGAAAGGTAVAGAAGAAGGAAAGGSALAAKTGLSLTDKLLLASTGTKALGTLLQPSAKKQHEIANSFTGSFYGMDSKGRTAPTDPAASTSKSTAPVPTAAKKVGVPETTARARQLITQQGQSPGAQTTVPQSDSRYGVSRTLLDDVASEAPRFLT